VRLAPRILWSDNQEIENGCLPSYIRIRPDRLFSQRVQKPRRTHHIHLKHTFRGVQIQFSYNAGCSSTVDDDIVIDLAQGMPELEPDNRPCQAVGGVTFKGLVVLALRCHRLFKLRVYFQANKLAEVTSRTELSSPSEYTAGIPQTNCALTYLQVWEASIPESATLAIGLALL
jgi:hypothetical protein